MVAFRNNGGLRAVCEVGVSDRGDYHGKGIGLVDDKGRVAIPNALRVMLAKNSPRADGKDGGTVIIGAHPKHRCLIAYDPGYVPIMKARLEAREAAYEAAHGEPDYNIKDRNAASEPMPFDGSGRFVLPTFERRYARIEDVAFFHGGYDWITIWSPKLMIETPGIDPFLKEAAEFQCAEKGITL